MALPNSPPAEKPWIMRAPTITIGANIPIDEYVGANAVMAVPAIIRDIVNVRALLRPWRSATFPNTTAPNGRMTKVTPKDASVSKSDAVSFSAGKKTFAIVTAKKP